MLIAQDYNFLFMNDIPYYDFSFIKDLLKAKSVDGINYSCLSTKGMLTSRAYIILTC